MSCDDPKWRKSSYSTLPDNDCVEMCFGGAAVLIRASKNPVGPVPRVNTRSGRISSVGTLGSTTPILHIRDI
jgi:hypothetical protein